MIFKFFKTYINIFAILFMWKILLLVAFLPVVLMIYNSKFLIKIIYNFINLHNDLFLILYLTHFLLFFELCILGLLFFYLSFVNRMRFFMFFTIFNVFIYYTIFRSRLRLRWFEWIAWEGNAFGWLSETTSFNFTVIRFFYWTLIGLIPFLE